MTFIYSFLQKRKMHESQHGVVMVVLAYALSVLLLVLGSDVFYNIKSAAAGTNAEIEEETKETTPQDYSSLQSEEASERTEIISVKYDRLNMVLASELVVNTDRSYSSCSAELNKAGMLGQLSDYVAEAKSEAEQAKEQTKEQTKDQAKDQADEPTEESAIQTASLETSENQSFSIEVASFDTIITVSEEEVKMLQRIVESEAEGEDIVGKILIANVIFNRIADEDFPDSAEEVIFQGKDGEYQFSPVENGRYWKVDISEETKEAVKRALEGEDYSEGALYFVARKRTTSSSARWFDTNLTWLFKHGGHEFYK